MNVAAIEVESRKLIDVQLLAETDGINRCPYERWYMFKKCEVKTCKNYSTNTARSCLALDRQASTGSKIISDAEIHLFKFHDEGISTRNVSMRRKNAVDRVRCVVALHTFINHIKEMADASERYRRFPSKTLAKAAKSKPLKFRRLGFEPWMWGHITDKDLYREFVGREPEYKVHQLLFIDESTFESVRAEVISCEV